MDGHKKRLMYKGTRGCKRQGSQALSLTPWPVVLRGHYGAMRVEKQIPLSHQINTFSFDYRR